MHKFLLATIFAFMVSGIAYADVWDDESYSDDWGSPAQEEINAETPAPEPAPAPKTEPAPAPEEPAPEPAPVEDAQPVFETAPEFSQELIYEAEPKAEETVPEQVPAPVVADSAIQEDRQLAASEAAQSATAESSEKVSSGSGIHWIPLSISAVVAVAGGAMAYWFDSEAKKVTDDAPANKEEYKVHRDNAGKYQTVRAISIGVAAAGLVGVGLSIFF